MLDMDRQLRPVRRASFGVLGLALLASGPWLGWWTIVPLIMAGVAFRLAEARVEHAKRPEYALFAAWTATQVIMAISVALTGGPVVPTMAWFAVPVLTLGARFSERGIAAGVAISFVLIATVAFGVNAQAVFDNPPLLIAPVALIACVALFQTVLMRSDVKYRAEAVIDSLTGMLNRTALARRQAELEQQSRITAQPIGLIVGDLDHFKLVNDSYGHAVGDAVLRDVAYEIRKQLRAFDLSYRLGGEEFLVLLPGATLDDSVIVAERLRAAIAVAPLGGHPVTMSLGVAASTPGAPFVYAAVFADADARLYAAKRGGRNQVRPVPVGISGAA
jgi:diguanylate cyclase (GGDEF)-like protein